MVAGARAARARWRGVKLGAALRRFVAVYDRWVAESAARSRIRVRLVDHTRARFDAAGTWPTENRPWCWRCGERLRVSDDTGARARDGIHAWCYGR